MPDLARLRAKRLFLLDLDGTLYLDERLFDGAADFLRAIRSRGGTYRFLTNNSSRGAESYVEKLRQGFSEVGAQDTVVLCGDLSWGMSLEESLEDFLKVMPDYERVRTCSPNIPKCMYERAAETNMYIVAAPPMKQGRIELIRYFKEQSISFEYHRYGSISEVPPYE